jgi:hypothetical protein
MTSPSGQRPSSLRRIGFVVRLNEAQEAQRSFTSKLAIENTEIMVLCLADAARMSSIQPCSSQVPTISDHMYKW